MTTTDSGTGLTRASRVRGAVYGALIGDALGVPYEFKAPADLPDSEQIDMTPPKGFSRSHAGVPPGTWSDDGALLLALLDSVTAKVPFDPDDFGRRMVNWRDHGWYTPDGRVFDIGIQTSQALAQIARGIAALEANWPSENANGNGSLMRVLPVGLLHQDDGEAIRLARLQSIPTHAHVRSQLCCALYVLWVRAGLAGMTALAARRQASDILVRHTGPGEQHELALILDYAGPLSGSGYVVDSLWSAWHCVAGTGNFKDCVVMAVSMGHDTDTTAAIAGGLAGALYGEEGLPDRWRSALDGKETVERYLGQLVV